MSSDNNHLRLHTFEEPSSGAIGVLITLADLHFEYATDVGSSSSLHIRRADGTTVIVEVKDATQRPKPDSGANSYVTDWGGSGTAREAR